MSPLNKARAWLEVGSIRAKIYVALVLSAAVLWPAVAVSVWYAGSVRDKLDQAHAVMTRPLDPASTAPRPDAAALVEDARKLALRAQRDVITLLILTLGGVAAMLWYLPRQMVRPLQRLQNLIQRASDGDLTVVAPLGGGDEVAEIARAVNALVEQFHREQTLRTSRLQTLRRTLEVVCGQIADPVCVLNGARDVDYANEALLRLLDVPTATPVEGQPLRALCEDRALLDVVEKLGLGADEPSEPVAFETREGHKRKARVAAGVVRDAQGEVVRLVLVLRAA